MGADTQRNAFPGSVTNQLPRHCRVTPSLCHRLWYSPPAPPRSLYHPLASLIDFLVLLKLTMLPYFLQLCRFLFYLCLWCVWCVCVCMCVCYGVCVEVREEPGVLVLSFHLGQGPLFAHYQHQANWPELLCSLSLPLISLWEELGAFCGYKLSPSLFWGRYFTH